MSEPTRITHEDIERLLGTITRNDITPSDEKELDKVLEVMKALLEPGWDWYACKPCPFCGERAVIALPIEGVEKYKAGAHPQDAFPHQSADKRELVHSGIHPECWTKYLPAEEE